MNKTRVAFAVVLGGAFIALGTAMAIDANSATDLEWQRWAGLLAGIEALAFTAVGWVFGKEINRERAQSAEQRADSAETGKGEAAVQAATEAQKGRLFAQQVIAQAEGAAAVRGVAGELEAQGGGGPAHSTAEQQLRSLAEVAKREYNL